MRQYQYTILKQDGSFERIGPCAKKNFAAFRQMLNCDTIEIIPSMYYAGLGYGRCTMYGDEEARFNENNTTNPHFKVIFDAAGNPWDVVGTIICEKVWKE